MQPAKPRAVICRYHHRHLSHTFNHVVGTDERSQYRRHSRFCRLSEDSQCNSCPHNVNNILSWTQRHEQVFYLHPWQQDRFSVPLWFQICFVGQQDSGILYFQNPVRIQIFQRKENPKVQGFSARSSILMLQQMV